MVAMTALTSFVDGTIPHQGDLNNYGTNIDTLCQLTTGKTAASAVSSKPMCKVALNGVQSVGNSSDSLVVWSAARYSTDNMWVASVPNQMTVQTAGKYRLTTQADWDPNATGIRVAKIFVNGTTNANTVGAVQASASSSSDTVIQASALEPLAVGATIYVDVFQTSGGVVNLDVNFGGTWLIAEWVAPY